MKILNVLLAIVALALSVLSLLNILPYGVALPIALTCLAVLNLSNAWRCRAEGKRTEAIVLAVCSAVILAIVGVGLLL